MRRVDIVGQWSTPTPDALIGVLERTEDVVRVGRSAVCRRHTIRGVPGRVVDVLVAEDLRDPARADLRIVTQVARKAGRYDGAMRDRITVRRWSAHQADRLTRADIAVTMTGERVTVAIGGWSATYRALPADLDRRSLARVMMWHWRRYYSHLDDGDEIRALADEWEQEVRELGLDERWTLAEANRAASRRLYEISRERGWRKLDARQRARYDAPAMWVTDEWIARRRAELGHPTGASEASLRGSWEEDDQ